MDNSTNELPPRLVERTRRFQQLPEEEQRKRLASCQRIHQRLAYIGQWFLGLPPVVFVLILLQLVVEGRMLMLVASTEFVLLGVLTIYVLYRGKLIKQSNRYLDPDHPYSDKQ